MARPRLLGLAVFAAMLVPRPSPACVSEYVGPFHEIAKHADQVVIGEVVLYRDGYGRKVKTGTDGVLTMEVRVLQVLKGAAPSRVRIWGGFSSCHPPVTRYPLGSVLAFVLLPSSEPGFEYELRSNVDSTQPLPKSRAHRGRAVERLRIKAGLP